MSYEGLERFFIEKYESMEAERDALRERVLQLEGDLTGAEFGITDLRRKFKAVRGTVSNVSTLKSYMLDNGNVTCDQMREYIALPDEELFAKFRNKTISYYTVLKFERKTFQYTLMVKESRDEWVAFTDGGARDQLYAVPEEDDDLTSDDWFPAEREDEMVEALCKLLRERMGVAIERWEKENVDV